MSQTTHEDLEKANNADSDQTGSTPNKPSQPSGGASSFGDSSGSLFSIYSKAAEEEDNKMVERWQKDADGILIFTGLFSAALAALLTVTVQDLRPNSQDTSSFYLGNIYQILADPNATRASLPSPVLNPPPFSPPRYTIWVNLLWFLSLVMSLSCALLATSLHQWARRYIRLTQPARCSPEKRARMRAFFADGLDEMHVPWAVEGLPTLLHLSLFLFFGGLVIFLFHVDREVFGPVVWWIGLFSMVYVSITLLPLIRRDSLYYAPLSTPAWFLYAGIPYVTFKILLSITKARYYRLRMLGGVEKAADETVSERSSDIDIRIFDWTISALGDDISLEKFFEAIPGFVNSKLVHNFREHLSDDLLDRLSVSAHGFLGRTWSSNLVSDSEKIRRLNITMNAMGLIRVVDVSSILRNILFERRDEVPQSIEMGHALARWCASNDRCTALYAQSIIGRILGSLRERNDSWVSLAAGTFGLPERYLRDKIADGGDNVLLAILIHVIRQYLSVDVLWEVLEAFSKLEIRNTLPRLQHEFCILWNETAQEARWCNLGHFETPILVLKLLHPLYIALHQDTDACPAELSASTFCFFPPEAPFGPPTYPLCNIASHHSDSTACVPVPNSCADSLPIQSGNSPDASSRSLPRSGSIVSQQVEQGNIIAGPPSPSNSTTTSKIGEDSQDLSAIPHTSPINSGPPLTFALPPADTIPMEVFHHQTQSLRLVPSPPDTASNSLEHEGD
ncbi:hypothetical protein F5888DRAFT_1805738 [Russula emetica]|nr:hypothetical protein F5888DRAFT_1805738 [Russula emetica]